MTTQQQQSPWEPNIEELTKAAHILQALSDPTKKEYQIVFSSLDQYVQDTSFVLNLLHLFVRGSVYIGIENRQLAGLVIKNYICPKLHRYSDYVQYALKQEIVVALSDTHIDIQNTAAILFGYLSHLLPVEHWDEVLTQLLVMLQPSSSSSSSLQGSIKALKILCEDSCEKLCYIKNGDVLNTLVPQLISLLSTLTTADSMNGGVVRLDALLCLNSLIAEMPAVGDDTTSAATTNSSPPSSLSSASVSVYTNNNNKQPYFNDGNNSPTSFRASNERVISTSLSRSSSASDSHMIKASLVILSYMTPLLQGISMLANDNQAIVRATVCRSILLLTPTYSDTTAYQQLFPSICQFVLKALLDADEPVALVAGEFWGGLVEDNRSVVSQYLPELIPSLISRLVLSEDQLQRERRDAEAEATGEKELTFKPVHHRASTLAGDDGSGGGTSKAEEAELESQWTLRMQAALVLDIISLNFDPNVVLSIALPAVEAKLSDVNNIWHRECGMLALGALSNGCMDHMTAHLPQIFPFFLLNMEEAVPEMRCISCWVLSRYSNWLFDDENEQGYNLFGSSLLSLLKCMLDPTPKVQAAACSAMSTLAENAGDQMTPYLKDIFQVISQCFLLYGVKSTMLLIDLIGTIADSVGEELSVSESQLSPLYLPQLMERFRRTDDTDMYLFPVLECLTSVTAAAKFEMAPYSAELAVRCLKIVNNTMTLNAAVEAGAVTEDEAPVKDFAICGLDVLAGLCEGLGVHFATLVNQHTALADPLISLIFVCAHDPIPDLRQSALLLAGEIAKSSPSLLSPVVQQRLVEVVLLNLDEVFEPVCNNAIWAIGELAVQFGGALIQPYLGRLVTPMVGLMGSSELSNTIKQNICITLGRFCVTNTGSMLDIIPDCFFEFCHCVKLAPQTYERTHAFTGLTTILQHKPDILSVTVTSKSRQEQSNGNGSRLTLDNASSFILACASYDDPPEEPLLSQLSGVLRSLQQRLGEEGWRMMLKGVDEESVRRVKDMFRLGGSGIGGGR